MNTSQLVGVSMLVVSTAGAVITMTHDMAGTAFMAGIMFGCGWALVCDDHSERKERK